MKFLFVIKNIIIIMTTDITQINDENYQDDIVEISDDIIFENNQQNQQNQQNQLNQQNELNDPEFENLDDEFGYSNNWMRILINSKIYIFETKFDFLYYMLIVILTILIKIFGVHSIVFSLSDTQIKIPVNFKYFTWGLFSFLILYKSIDKYLRAPFYLFDNNSKFSIKTKNDVISSLIFILIIFTSVYSYCLLSVYLIQILNYFYPSQNIISIFGVYLGFFIIGFFL